MLRKLQHDERFLKKKMKIFVEGDLICRCLRMKKSNEVNFACLGKDLIKWVKFMIIT
jgi:hypothetical protein